jgi:acyl-coenzyme A thioesterase PaaI-like protein
MGIDYTQVGELMKSTVPWVATAGIDYVEVSADRVITSLPDVDTARNHVGGPHAAMMFGLGETASGAIVVAAFADQLTRAVPLPTKAEISFRKIATGDLTAEAVLGRNAAEVVAELDNGTRPEFPVQVTIRNADGETTSEMTVVWTLRPHRSS